MNRSRPPGGTRFLANDRRFAHGLPIAHVRVEIVGIIDELGSISKSQQVNGWELVERVQIIEIGFRCHPEGRKNVKTDVFTDVLKKLRPV